ncbi:MAG: hypothetical protein KF703_17440, partial [Actinobacteria bacterium]|nr:hypothetical protein [Actinomycetota bacterium]
DRASARPVRPGVWQPASIRVFPYAHLLRAGSRLKVSIHTPGGDHRAWSFRPDPLLGGAEPTIDIGTGGTHPSTISIGSVPAPVSRPLPECGVLRGQACRPYVAYANSPTAP